MVSGNDPRLDELAEIAKNLSEAPVKILLLSSTLASAQNLAELFHQAYPQSLRIYPCSLWELAAELASPSVSFFKLKLLTPLQQESLVATAWHQAKSELPVKVVEAFQNHSQIIPSLRSTIHEMRMVGMESADIDTEAFPNPDKGVLLKAVLQQYEQLLNNGALADPARVLVLARDRLLAEGGIPSCKIILAEEITAKGLFQSILDHLPMDDVVPLSTKRPAPNRRAYRDSQRLAWLNKPQQAPVPLNDGSLIMHRALSPEYEVRAVLGTLIRNQIPFDEVEVFYTDESIYPGLFYSLVNGLRHTSEKKVPLCFRGGIPLIWTRPGRALQFWLRWIQSSFRREPLIELLLQRLLILPKDHEETLLNLIRSIPPCTSKSSWLRQLQLHIDHPEANALRNLFQDILEPVPESNENIEQAWRAAEKLLNQSVCDDSWDLQATKFLEEMLSVFCQESFQSTLHVWQRLSARLENSTLPDEMEKPGSLLLTPISLQESPRKKWLFCIGMSEDHYPSIPRHESLLTDRERRVLSPELQQQTTRELLRQQDNRFIRSLQEYDGQVMFTYPSANQMEDRELFPSQLFLRIFRLQTGLPEGDLHELESWLPAPLGPDTSLCHLTPTESWLDHFPEQPFTNALFRSDFPMLWRGAHAAKKRKSYQFTEFDGYVPEAGGEFDPMRSKRSFSAHSLQRYHQCPLKFFFHDVLRLQAPEYTNIQPGQWLTALLRGEILHDVFHQYHVQLLQERRKPDRLKDAILLQQLLQKTLQRRAEVLPETSAHIRNQEISQLHESLHFFLLGEAQLADQYTPRYFETTIGMKHPPGLSELDTDEPVSLRLPSGKTIQIQGRIDRIDTVLLNASPSSEYYIWDYKSGRIAEFQGTALRKGGQMLQPLLYVEIAEKRLRQIIGNEATVTGAGYFFPGHHGGQGDRIQWPATELRKHTSLIDAELELMQAGIFLATDQQETCRLCEFKTTCAVGEVNDQAHRKQGHQQNPILTPLRVLRKSS
ncbi:MAG: PD-(D/E)XK nuclease family protein [Planctomycetia bacterium]|nr:PD-(D/E)XK nuclease family protein [Planctomycetia bacterium]